MDSVTSLHSCQCLTGISSLDEKELYFVETECGVYVGTGAANKLSPYLCFCIFFTIVMEFDILKICKFTIEM